MLYFIKNKKGDIVRIIKYFHIFSFISILLSFTACRSGEDSSLSNEVDLNRTESVGGYISNSPVINQDYISTDSTEIPTPNPIATSTSNTVIIPIQTPNSTPTLTHTVTPIPTSIHTVTPSPTLNSPILTYTPSSTPLNLIKSKVKGKVGSKVLINGKEVGKIGTDGTLDIWLDTSGDSGVKEFRVVLIDTAQNESNPLIIKIEKITFQKNFINEGNCSQIIDNGFIVICYDYQLKSAKSVAYHLDGDLVNELNIEDRPPFYEEESLDEKYRATYYDYTNSGYDRGHLAPDASFDWSDESLNAVYTLANIIPQAPKVNRNMWIDVEKYARRKAVELGEIDVVNVVKFLPEHKRIGEHNISVSKGFYKILYSQDNNYTDCFYYENSLDANDTDDNLSLHHIDCVEVNY